MSTCWYCNSELIWQSDFNYDEVYGDGEGIVSYLSCPHCGADVEYSVRTDESLVDIHYKQKESEAWHDVELNPDDLPGIEEKVITQDNTGYISVNKLIEVLVFKPNSTTRTVKWQWNHNPIVAWRRLNKYVAKNEQSI